VTTATKKENPAPVLPAGWKWVKLGDVARFESGVFLPRDAVTSEGPVPVYGANGVIGFTDKATFREPRIVIGRVGSCGAVNLTSGPSWITDNTIICNPTDAADRLYLYLYLKNVDFDALRTASIQPLITQSGLRRIELPLPPLSEQKRIAGILTEQMAAVERARRAAEAELEAAKALPSAYLRQVFNSEEAKAWPRKRLDSVAHFRHGGTPSKGNDDFWKGPVPWVSPKDMGGVEISDTQDHISHHAISQSATTLVPANTLLVVIRSGILARTVPIALTRREMAFNQDIKAIIPRNELALSEFVLWYLRSIESYILGQGIKYGATVHSMKSGFVEDLVIPCPALVVQKRIVAILTEQTTGSRELVEAARAKLELINRIPAALLRKAFSGEL
jgi:type I restriction enzyme S subunit